MKIKLKLIIYQPQYRLKIENKFYSKIQFSFNLNKLDIYKHH